MKKKVPKEWEWPKVLWLKGQDGVLRKLPLDLKGPRTVDELQKELLRLSKLTQDEPRKEVLESHG